MPDPVSAVSLLKAAAALYDAPEYQLAQAAQRSWRRGFASGGDWMRLALGVVRGERLFLRSVSFNRLGWIKYGLACTAAFSAVAVAILTGNPWILFAAIPLFYLVEAQMVFLFPLAIDGSSRAMTESAGWTRRAGGTLQVMGTVMTIALTMMFGGLFRRGFLRSWCVGCLAVLVWYEKLRKAKDSEVSGTRSRLEIGARYPLLVRRTQFRMFGNERAVHLVYASDLHFHGRTSPALIRQLLQAVQETSPDLIILGGDLADTKGGLAVLSNTVKELVRLAPVYAIPGNHDYLAGLASVASAVESGGGTWIGGQSFHFQPQGRKPFYLDGAIPENLSSRHNRVLCAHDPAIFPEAAAIGYPLVLAGHLHGGQIVLAERHGRFFPGAWVYRWNGRQFQLKQSTLLVSRGVSDTLPMRWNCPREILLCELY